MTKSSATQDSADEALSRILEHLPLRHAPGTLESRVLLQLQRQQGAPWWRQGFAHWPLAARVAFVSTCITFSGLTLLDTTWSMLGTRALNGAVAWSMSWIHPAVGAIASAAELSTWPGRVIPTEWLYAFVATGALLYTALFALGATAYRTLYLPLFEPGSHL